MEATIRQLPVLPLRGLTAFPEMLIHFDVGRVMSIKALESAMKDGQMIFLTAQKDLKTDVPESTGLFETGTVCKVKQILRMPGDNIRVLVEGQSRGRALEFIEGGDHCLFARVEVLDDQETGATARRVQALVRTVQDRFEQYADLAPRISNDVIMAVADGLAISPILSRRTSTSILR